MLLSYREFQIQVRLKYLHIFVEKMKQAEEVAELRKTECENSKTKLKEQITKCEVLSEYFKEKEIGMQKYV